MYERKCSKCGNKFRWDDGIPPVTKGDFKEYCPDCDIELM